MQKDYLLGIILPRLNSIGNNLNAFLPEQMYEKLRKLALPGI
jgi:hypothetical protein